MHSAVPYPDVFWSWEGWQGSGFGAMAAQDCLCWPPHFLTVECWHLRPNVAAAPPVLGSLVQIYGKLQDRGYKLLLHKNLITRIGGDEEGRRVPFHPFDLQHRSKGSSLSLYLLPRTIFSSSSGLCILGTRSNPETEIYIHYFSCFHS